MNKLLVICGPTATGKTAVGIKLAKKFQGEIVSADSRQVYKGMDIITGKDIDRNSELKNQNLELNIENKKLTVGYRLKDDIPIWLVDIVEPDYLFNVGEYAIAAYKVIRNIWGRHKLPIIVGGTGFYIRAIVERIDTVIIPPNKLLRKRLEQCEKEALQQELIKAAPEKWERMNTSDRANPRRLIRAIEIALYRQTNKGECDCILNPLEIDSLLMIGLKASSQFLFQKVDERVEKRIKEGVVEEIKKLLGQNYSLFLPSLSTTGCKEISEYLQGKEQLTDVVNSWKFREREYVRRQMSWLRKEKRIQWFDITDKDHLDKIVAQVEKWYTAS